MSFEVPPIDTAAPLSGELHRLANAHAGSAVALLACGDIYKTRRLLKRLRAILRLAGGDRVAAAVERDLRDVGRLLSPCRDLEMTRELLPSFTDHLPTAEEAQLHRLFDRDTRHEAALAQALPILRHSAARLRNWHPQVSWKTLGTTIARSYRQAQRHLEQCRSALRKKHFLYGADAEPLHEMRKALKRLGHQLQFLPIPTISGGPAHWLERKKTEAHRVSSLLGQEHDIHVLEASLGPHARSLFPVLNARRAVVQNEAIRSAAGFLKKKPPVFTRKLRMHLVRLQRN